MRTDDTIEDTLLFDGSKRGCPLLSLVGIEEIEPCHHFALARPLQRQEGEMPTHYWPGKEVRVREPAVALGHVQVA